MKAVLSPEDQTLVKSVGLYKFTPDVYYIVVRTDEKWPEWTFISGLDQFRGDFRGVCLRKDDENSLHIDVELFPDTIEEEKVFDSCTEGFVSARYGVDFFIISNRLMQLDKEASLLYERK